MYKYILCSSWTFTVLQGLDAALPQNIWIKWMTQYQAFAKLDVIMSDGLNKSKSKHHVTDQKVISMIFLIRCSILNSIFVFAGNKHLFFYLKKKTKLSSSHPAYLCVYLWLKCHSYLFFIFYHHRCYWKKSESIRPPLNIAESTIHTSLDYHVETTERSRQHIHAVHLIYISIQDLKRVCAFVGVSVCVWAGYALISGLCTQTVISKIPDLISNFKSSGCADEQLC